MLYEAAVISGMDIPTQRNLAASLHSKLGGNKRQIEIGILFFARCRTGNKHHFGLTKDAARFALEQAVETGDPVILQKTTWCIEDYVAWSENVDGNRRPGIRIILSDYANTKLKPQAFLDAETFKADSDREALEAQNLSDEELKSRATRSDGKPVQKVKVVSYAYSRNQFVRELALRRANGSCERIDCPNPAPFQRIDGRTFLEVHHTVPLAEGGPDTIENAIALCPNCHREAHYGQNWEKFRH